MKKWRHIWVSYYNPEFNYKNGHISIFPANRIELDGLFKQFPKLRRKDDEPVKNHCTLETHSHITGDVYEALLIYLEDHGWEYCSDNTFKRLVDNE